MNHIESVRSSYMWDGELQDEEASVMGKLGKAACENTLADGDEMGRATRRRAVGRSRR